MVENSDTLDAAGIQPWGLQGPCQLSLPILVGPSLLAGPHHLPFKALFIILIYVMPSDI